MKIASTSSSLQHNPKKMCHNNYDCASWIMIWRMVPGEEIYPWNGNLGAPPILTGTGRTEGDQTRRESTLHAEIKI